MVDNMMPMFGPSSARCEVDSSGVRRPWFLQQHHWPTPCMHACMDITYWMTKTLRYDFPVFMLFLRHGDVISNLFPVKTADEVFKHQTSNPEMTQNQWASENLTWNAKPEATMPRSASTKNRRYMQLYSILWKIVLQQNASRSRI